jgi:hypothetical protein
MDRERACQLFKTLLLITNRRLKSQQQSIEQHLLSLCSSTIEPLGTHSSPLISSSSTLLFPSSLLSSTSSQPSPASQPVEGELFRNSSRSGSVCLIDPLLTSSTPKGSSNSFPTVVQTKIATVTGGSGVGGPAAMTDPPRRYDLEYRYPYKSFIPQGGERGGERVVGVPPPNQNIYAMTLGNNVLLTTPTLVQDMIHVVLTRRKIEEKFNSVTDLAD